MALSGSFTGSIRRGYSIRVDWSATQNYSSNSSTITCNLYFINDYAINIGARTNSITISGQKFTLKSNAITTVGTHYIGKATKTIAHNSDGTSPTVSISAVFNIAATLVSTYYENITASGSAVFNTIPRTSQVSVTSPSKVIIGKTPITIKTNRKSTAFTHNIGYLFEGKNVLIGTAVGDSITWTPPDELYALIPNKSNGVCQILCDTYNGGTKIGSSQTSFTLYVDVDNVRPTVTSWTISEGNEAVKQIGLGENEFIDKTSIFNVSVSGLTTYKSAAFSIMAFAVGDAYGESTDKTGLTLNKPSVNVSGEVDANILILDSRGIFNGYQKKIKIYPYKLPVDKTSVSRLNNYEAQTTIAPNVEIATFGGKHSSLSYKYRYYQKNASPGEYISFENLVSSNGKVTGKNVELILDNTKEWIVDLQFSDGLNTITRTETVSRGVPMFFMNSDTGDFEAYGDIYSQGQKIDDFVVEQGEKNGWYYRIWKSGIKECWMRGAKAGINMTANHYSGYYYSAPIDITLPFKITPKFAICKGGSTSLINELKEVRVADDNFRFWVYGLDKSATNISVIYNLYVIGK